jgi:type I site-specific restriction endonuclease
VPSRLHVAGDLTWRSTLDHFDAIKIGLTATPASHTTAYFSHKVFEYPYEQAVAMATSLTTTCDGSSPTCA